jgi:3-oxoacyl-[acyl-carrier-protein] synthase II
VNTRRVVITGSGFVLPLGSSVPQVLAGLAESSGPFVPALQDRDVAACPVPNFDLKRLTGRFKNLRYLTRGQELCLAAAMLAVQDGGLKPEHLHSAGLFLGIGPNIDASVRRDKALWLLDYLPNTLAAVTAQILGVHGENLTILTACAASTQALGQAWLAVSSGRVLVALAGGGDSRLSGPGILAYKQAGVLATGFSQAAMACRPFDQSRHGFAVGEGGAVFVLESLEHARERRAPILAEVVAASSSLDGYSLTGPDPSGAAAGQAVGRVLAALDPDAVCIVAHGTGTVLNDAVESAVISRTVPVAKAICAFKSRIGHLAAACGAAELALSLVCLRHGWFPAIANLENPCHPDLPFLREPARIQPSGLIVQSFGFGGQNACLGVRPWT